jgi:Tol biopolymer transport system component
LFATTAAPGPVYTRAPASLTISRDTPGGPLFFWSASTNGVMRGGVDATAPAKLFPPSGAASGACVGCHTVSRDSRQMAIAVEDGTSFDLQALDVVSLASNIQPTSARRMAFATYSPDGKRLVAAIDGVLTEYDASTGAVIGTIALGANKFGTHPDWSPDGTKLALSLSPQAPTEMDVKSSSIAVIPHSAAGWGAPQVLVAGVASNNNYFPRWSPDGTKLAYVHATTTSQGAVSAQLMLLPAAGGTPISLTVANTRVGVTSLVDLANTTPAWGPTIGDHAWLAFVSIRAYGAVASGRAQIWITSVDLASPADSSTPAFWLPSQDSTVVNNTPTWIGDQFTL